MAISFLYAQCGNKNKFHCLSYDALASCVCVRRASANEEVQPHAYDWQQPGAIE